MNRYTDDKKLPHAACCMLIKIHLLHEALSVYFYGLDFMVDTATDVAWYIDTFYPFVLY